MADFATLVAAVQLLHLHYLVAATLGFLVGVAVCYVLSLRWAFAEHSYQNRKLEIVLFAAIGVIGVVLNNFVMWGLVEFAHASYPTAKVFAAALVLVFNFTTRRSCPLERSARMARGPGHRRRRRNHAAVDAG